MELNHLNQRPISTPYIPNLLKHSKIKQPINPNSSSSSLSSSSSSSSSSIMAEQIPKSQPTQPHKKQVRRRLHTSRPYQERLLNMAEARREIVTALKYHRAAMKKAAAATSTATAPQSPVEESSPVRSQEGKIKPRKIPKSSTTAERNRETPQSNFKCYNNNNLKNLGYDPSMMMMMNCSLPSWSMEGNNNIVDIVLPEQTLGLNLNLQDFKNLDANLFSNSRVSVSVSGSTSTSIGRDEEQEGGGRVRGGMHVAVGEEEIAEMRTIGEKHEMEWSDKMSMVKSAWWLRFMKMGKREEEEDQEDQLEGFGCGYGYGYGDPFDQILEFPDWMNNGNENCFEEQLMLNDYSQFFHHDHPSALPCMDIGEFEGMDGEWLA